MAQQVTTNLDFGGVAKITSLPQAVANGEPVVLEQLNAAIEGLAWKDNCRVSTSSNINLASPGATLDGISMALNDRVLVRGQTTQSQNGIYVWNGAAVAMTRAADANTADELENAVTTVDEGTSAGSTFRQQTLNFTLDTGNVVWVTFGASVPNATESTAGIVELATQAEVDTGTDATRAVTPLRLANWSGRRLKGSASFGDGSTTQFDFTHNFNTQDLVAQVRRTSGAFDVVLCDIEYINTTTVRVRFAVAPSSNQYRITVIG